MSDNLTFQIYLDRIKQLRQRLVGVGALLLIFIITFGLLLLKELNIVNQQVKELNDIKKGLQLSWKEYKYLYDSSFEGLEEYIANYSNPYTQSTFLTGLNIARHKEGCNQCDTFSIQQYDKINEAIRILLPYNKNLRKLLISHRLNKRFSDLSADELKVLREIFLFRNDVIEEKLKKGIQETIIAQKKLLKLDEDGIFKVKRSFTRKVYKSSINSQNKSFESFDVILMNFKDPYFGNYLSDDFHDNFKNAINFLEKNDFQNYDAFIERNNFLKNQIKTTFTRDLVMIPILNFNLSLKQFYLFGGIINLGILLYFYFMIVNLYRMWDRARSAQELTLDVSIKKALFYGLDYQIRNQIIFIIINSLFFSIIPILSVVISLVLKRNTDENIFNSESIQSPRVLIFLIPILIINIVFSIYLSKKQFNLNKGEGQ